MNTIFKGPAGCLHATALAVMLVCSSLAAAQQKPLETLTGGHALSNDASQRLYVMDSVFFHLTESRVGVFDGASGKFLGMIPTSYNGHMLPSRDGKRIYTMTTYHERVTRGKRTDVVEIWDASKLTFKSEIVIPTKRAQALNYNGIFRESTDGKFIILQNATPAV